jgi:putative thiamine transport system permease protein
VLAWQWLSQGDDMQQAKGALASLLLLAILGGLALVAWGGWRLQRRRLPDLRGIRHPILTPCPAACWRRCCR